MLKKPCFLLLAISIIYIHPVAFATASHPILLKKYSELLNAINQGDEVKAIIDHSKCTPLPNAPIEQLIAGISFNQFIQLKFTNEKPYTAASHHALINHRLYGYVYDYSVVRIHDDDSVEIAQQFLNPKDFSPATDKNQTLTAPENKYICNLSNGNDNNGVKLYDLSSTSL